LDFVVAFACDLTLRDGRFEFCNLGRGELDISGCCIFLKIFAAFGAGDRSEVVALGEDPGEGKLAGFYATAVRDGGYAVDEDLVLVEVVAGESWIAFCAEVPGAEVGLALDGSGEKSATEWRVGDEADAEFADCGKDLGFDVTLPEGVLGLEGGDGVDLVGAADGCG
jgi:hypothetical protein